jgi:membrane fusion protein, multidrug efflux system
MKRWLIMMGAVIALIVVIGGIWGYNTSKKFGAYKATLANKKDTVSTVKAAAQEWREQLLAVGSLRATRGADLATDVAGVVDAIRFESGSDVKGGELLAELRAGDDVGKLESLRANAQLTKLTFDRARAQFDAQAISQAELDIADANLKSANAQVNEQQAIVEKKRIRAPFAGHLGIRNVDPGQYVAAGTKIVTLQTLDPIYVDFSLPQQSIARLRTGQRVEAKSDTYPDVSFNGSITAIDPKVDTDTRNVQVRATLQNPQRKLLPGMFINVSVDLGKPTSYITLPITSLSYNPYGTTAYVVVKADSQKEADSKTTPNKSSEAHDKNADGLVAKQVFVTTGPTRGDQVAVLKGIAVGDDVVTAGQLKLKHNSPVLINNSVQPASDIDPHPTEQ